MISFSSSIRSPNANIWILFVFLSIAFISCDCGYNYEFIIDNNTNSELSVYCKAEYCCGDGIKRTISVPKDTSIIIWSSDVFAMGGCPGPFQENCAGLIDSIFITMNDSLTTKLNYKDVNNWVFTGDGKANNSKGTYKISLSNSDFILLKKINKAK